VSLLLRGLSLSLCYSDTFTSVSSTMMMMVAYLGATPRSPLLRLPRLRTFVRLEGRGRARPQLTLRRRRRGERGEALQKCSLHARQKGEKGLAAAGGLQPPRKEGRLFCV